MVTIVIPSRNEQFLVPTVNELLSKARGEIEIIVVMDGYWEKNLPDDPRVRVIHKGQAEGMRQGITDAAAIARGDFLMKIDGHCMVDEGYDVKLAQDCEPNWVVIPRRKRLDAENWCVQDVGKPDVDYNYLSFPDNPSDFGGPGLNGRIWTAKILERKDDPKYDIDEEFSFQGSCWFMPLAHFHNMELMDYENWGPFWNEAQEIGFKTWLSGGKVMRNKKTWYAHLHKGKKYGRGYRMDNKWAIQGASQANKWLRGDYVWPKQKMTVAELLEKKFLPMPGWPKDWKDQLGISEKQHSDIQKKNDPQQYIIDKFGLPKEGTPIEIPNFGREQLPELLVEMGLTMGAEIGVETGLYAESLCRAGIKLYAVDSWTTYPEYREHVTQEKINGFYKKAKERLEPYGATLIKKFSTDAAKDFKDGSLDFVYIDGNHRIEQVIADLTAWIPKVKKGGIVAGHDFRRFKQQKYCHVVDAIHAWTRSYRINPWFVLGTRAKKEGEIRDNARSWMFIK